MVILIYFSTILVFAFVLTLLLGIYKVINREKIAVNNRLATIADKKSNIVIEGDELSEPFFERVIKPFLHKLANKFNRFMPIGKKTELYNKLLMGGNPGNLSPGEFIAFQYALAFGLPVLLIAITLLFGGSLSKILIVVIVVGIFGYILPDFYLKTKIKSRQNEISKNLPDVLDLLTVSVEAGLGFDAALAKVVEKIKGVLSDEFARVLQETKIGKPRRDALRDLGQRCGVEDLVTFVGAVIQADQLGVSIGNVLRLQSVQMRQKRRNVIEEKAMKAPIKMLIPLILFIFPTIFIVILGPALIQIVGTISK